MGFLFFLNYLVLDLILVFLVFWEIRERRLVFKFLIVEVILIILEYKVCLVWISCLVRKLWWELILWCFWIEKLIDLFWIVVFRVFY